MDKITLAVRSNLQNQNTRTRRCDPSLDLVNNQFSGSNDTNELFTYVEEILPVPKDSFKILSVKGSSEKLKTKVQYQLQNVEEVEVFVSNYMDAMELLENLL